MTRFKIFLTWLNFYRVKIIKQLNWKLNWKVIFIIKTSHLDSRWKRGWSELRNGLLWNYAYFLQWTNCKRVYKMLATLYGDGSLMTACQIYTISVGPIKGQWKTFQTIYSARNKANKMMKLNTTKSVGSWLASRARLGMACIAKTFTLILGTLFIFLFKIILILSAQLSNLNIFSLERLIITTLIQYYINMQDRPRVEQLKAFKVHLNLLVSVEKKVALPTKKQAYFTNFE